MVRMRGEGERSSRCMAAPGDVNVSPAVRSLRAAVFAVLCVLLAAGGHVLAMGTAPPVWVQVVGALPVFVVGCLLGGRERSLVGIGGGTLAAQGALHLAFDAGRPHAVMVMHGMRMSPTHPHSHALTPHATAVHVMAALVLTWWLRRGEAALWSLLRRAVVFVPGLAAWWQVAAGFRGVSSTPEQARRAVHGAWSPRRLRLRYAVHRRGPPPGMSYAVRPSTSLPSTEIHSLMSTTRTTLRRAGLVTALAATGVLTAAGVASAHVTVHPESYAKGATDGVLTFRVPNEENTAGTTKVQVFLPTDHPVLGVLVTPQDGWTAKVTDTKLKTPVKTDDGTITDAVSEITWTGGRIGAGQYQDFDVAFGQLPDDTDQLTFKTLQTYSDGKTVRWIEEASAGQEPENPAPVLKLTAKSAQDGDSGAPTASAAPSKTSGSAKPTASSSDATARGLGIGGLVVGVLGLAAAVFAVLRNRSAGSRAE
ncbi:membrane protein [Streptomyces olivochromogenes]|uniref:Membrane protein n=2 Tax=Streptomyces olivochromogenes TaxID=1963 RepID=A0A250VNU8_STROL|nr:membrane protein [Streptomyces olivochromogenes]